jgi:hypothetical protein
VNSTVLPQGERESCILQSKWLVRCTRLQKFNLIAFITEYLTFTQDILCPYSLYTCIRQGVFAVRFTSQGPGSIITRSKPFAYSVASRSKSSVSLDVFGKYIKRLVLPTHAFSLSSWLVHASPFASLPAYPFPRTRLPMNASLSARLSVYASPLYQFPCACFLSYQLVCSPPHRHLAARIFVLPGCDAVSLVNWFLTFRKKSVMV